MSPELPFQATFLYIQTVDKDLSGGHNESMKNQRMPCIRRKGVFHGYHLYYRTPESRHGFHCLRHGVCRAEKRAGPKAVSGCPPGAGQRRDADCAGQIWVSAAPSSDQCAHPGPGPGLRHSAHTVCRRYHQPGLADHAGQQDLCNSRGQRGRDAVRHAVRGRRGLL